MSFKVENSLIASNCSSFFIRGLASRAFDKEVLRLFGSLGTVPEGATVIMPDLFVEIAKDRFRGAILLIHRDDRTTLMRDLWINRMMEYAESSPAHSVIWLEQGIFYWLDDFSIITPPFLVSCRGYSERYSIASEVLSITGASLPYEELVQQDWVLTRSNYSYRPSPLAQGT